jgi:hypothetical protein
MDTLTTEMLDARAPDPVTGQEPVDPATGQPVTEQVQHEVPAWMPDEQDNVPV